LNTKGTFKDYFDFYNIDEFEKAYSNYFKLMEKKPIENSERVMYLFQVKEC
jgi:hypothetical protein